MSEVKIYITGDDSKFQQISERMLRDHQKLIDNYTKGSDKVKKLTDEEIEAIKKKAAEEKAFQQLQEKANVILSKLTSAEEDYTKGIAEAKDMREKGLLTEQKYTQRVQQLQQELRDASGETKRLKDAQDAQERALVKADATTKKYMTTIEKLKAELADVSAQHHAGLVEIETVERAQKKLNAELAKPHGETTKWLGKVTAVATAYVSVSSAIAQVTQAMERQRAFQDKAVDVQNKLAVAQQESIKNFSGMSEADMTKAIETPLKLSKELNFIDPAAATQAMGELYSTVNDLKKDESALREGMRLTPLTPGDVGAVSTGLLKIQETVGIDDARKAAGFMASFGVASPVNDPRKQAEALAPVVETTVANYTKADKEGTAKTAAAILATMTERGSDADGRESTTATITLIGKINELFKDLKDPKNEANAKMNREIAKLEKSAVVTEKESQNIKNAEAKVKKTTEAFDKADPKQSDYQKLKLAKETAEVNLRDAERRSTLTEKEKARLAELRQQRDSLASINAPETLSEQIALIQKTPALRERLFETSFGEQKFKTPMEQLVTSGTDTAKSFLERQENAIKFSPEMHEQAVKDINTKTDVLQRSQALNRAQASIVNRDAGDSITAAMGSINKIRSDVLAEAFTPFGANPAKSLNEYMGATIGGWQRELYGDNPAAAASAAFNDMSLRRTQLLRPDWDGVTRQDLQNVEVINKQLLEMSKVLQSVIDQLNASQKAQAEALLQKIQTTNNYAEQRMNAISVSHAARLQAAGAGAQ